MNARQFVTSALTRFGRALASLVEQRPAPFADDTPRAQRLGALHSLYRGTAYEGRGLAPPWDKTAPGPGPRAPLRMQIPAVVYDLARVIVDRPTSMLFGEGRAPMVHFEASNDADEAPVSTWLTQVLDEARWPVVALTWARQGGAIGSACITWALVEGAFEFTPHLSYQCTPTFHPRTHRILQGLEKRYVYLREIEELQDGRKVTRQEEWWHRETWSTTEHIVFDDVPKGDGREPVWTVADRVVHGFGFCPAVWVKNLDDGDTGPDGASLLDGVVTLLESIDRTLTGVDRGTRYNAEPEKIYTGLPLDPATKRPIEVGGGASTSLPAGADAKLLEIKGDSLKTGMEHVRGQRDRALEVARVVTLDPERALAAAKSGAALLILHRPMVDLVGELRQSYGYALRDLLGQILRAAREGKLSALGTLESPPPAPIPPGRVQLKWGPYFAPTPEDIDIMARVVVSLLQAGLIDRETAVRYMADTFGLHDVEAMLEKIEEEEHQRAQAEAEAAAKAAAAMRMPPPQEEPPAAAGD